MRWPPTYGALNQTMNRSRVSSTTNWSRNNANRRELFTSGDVENTFVQLSKSRLREVFLRLQSN